MAKVRHANVEQDFEKILLGARKFAASVGRPDVMPEPDSLELDVAVASVIGRDDVGVVVAENDDGDIVGGFGYSVSPFLWDHTKLAGEEIFWWVDAGAPPTVALRMLKLVLEDWKSAGVSVTIFHRLPTSPKELSRVYEKLGAREAQTTYIGAM